MAVALWHRLCGWFPKAIRRRWAFWLDCSVFRLLASLCMIQLLFWEVLGGMEHIRSNVRCWFGFVQDCRLFWQRRGDIVKDLRQSCSHFCCTWLRRTTPLTFHPVFHLIVRALLTQLLKECFYPAYQHTAQPSPNGIAQVLDLTVFVSEEYRQWFRLLFNVASFLYIFKLLMFPSLFYITFYHIAVHTLHNSQGSIGHFSQALSLVMLTQCCYYGLILLRKWPRLDLLTQLEVCSTVTSMN